MARDWCDGREGGGVQAGREMRVTRVQSTECGEVHPWSQLLCVRKEMTQAGKTRMRDLDIYSSDFGRVKLVSAGKLNSS